MKRPNFFIIGAPKCGTTSLAKWLSEHPQIFMSPAKEPHYFDHDHTRETTSLKVYEHYFRGAGDEHIAVGEASVRYLHSQVAINEIERYSPDAKYIVMLRNPVEMAPSLHEQRFFNLQENIPDFETAWELQATRAQGNSLPAMCTDPSRLQYAENCNLGMLIERLLKVVPRSRCLFIFLEDVISAPRMEYLRTLFFLGVEDDGRTDFLPENQAKMRRSLHIAQFSYKVARFKQSVFPRVGSLGILSNVQKWNKISRKRLPLRPETKQMLQDYFRDDIVKLSVLLGRDLKHWLK